MCIVKQKRKEFIDNFRPFWYAINVFVSKLAHYVYFDMRFN